MPVAAAESKPVKADSQSSGTLLRTHFTAATYRSLLLCMPTMPLPCQPTS